MRQATVDRLIPGTVLARPVYDDQMRLLLKQGTTLTDEYIGRLRKFEFQFIYIQEEGTESIIAEDLIDVEDRRKVFSLYNRLISISKLSGKSESKTANDARSMIRTERTPNKIRILKQASQTLLDSVLHGTNNHYYPSTALGLESDFSHSFEVALLSVMIGMRFHYDRPDLENLAQASLLHDLGKSSWTPAERIIHPLDRSTELQKKYLLHPKMGSDIVMDDDSLPLSVSVAIYQHHENFDGTGFPERISGDPLPPTHNRPQLRGKIFRHAEIIAVSDYFDNLVNGRVRLESIDPLNAVEEMLSLSGKWFHPHVVAAAMSIINVFPVSSLVRVENARNMMMKNYAGVVAKVNPNDLQHPQVLLLRDELNHRLERPLLIDFSKEQGSRLAHIADF